MRKGVSKISKIEYTKGQILNENSQLKYIEEIEPVVYKNGKKSRRAKLQCKCGKIFEGSIANAKRGQLTTCGCRWNRVYKKQEWKKGEIINEENNIVFVEELEPKIYADGKRYRQIRCQCSCGRVFDGDYKEIKNGKRKSCGCKHKKNAPKGKENKNFIQYNKGDILNKDTYIIFLEDIDNSKPRKAKVQCKCGEIFEGNITAIKNGTKRDCGCGVNRRQAEPPKLKYKYKDCLNKKTRILFLEDLGYNENRKRCVKCQCSCGEEFVEELTKITTGSINSCGCMSNQKGKQLHWKGDIIGPHGVVYLEERPMKQRGDRLRRRALFQCPLCENTFEAFIEDVASGGIASCRCKLGKKDLVGQTFGLLTVVKDTGKRNRRYETIWLCECECGNSKEVVGKHLIEGHTMSCGCLSMSHGEFLIKQNLDALNIDYIQEYRLKNNQRLDFYLPKYNVGIEFDGEQHFIENNFFKYSLLEQQISDKKKNEYCQEVGIKLIRIPYFDIDKINEEYIVKN